MMYRLVLQPDAQKKYLELSERERIKVLRALDRLKQNPWCGKKLGGEFDGRYSVRAWPLRIIYRIEKHVLLVVVIRIGHRKDVYR